MARPARGGMKRGKKAFEARTKWERSSLAGQGKQGEKRPPHPARENQELVIFI